MFVQPPHTWALVVLEAVAVFAHLRRGMVLPKCMQGLLNLRQAEAAAKSEARLQTPHQADPAAGQPVPPLALCPLKLLPLALCPRLLQRGVLALLLLRLPRLLVQVVRRPAFVHHAGVELCLPRAARWTP